MMSPIRVAIIGAGPAGLMLAKLLHNQPGIDVVVFESDHSRQARKQGGTLDLHPDTGLAALKAGGLYDEFLSRARFDGEAVKLCDENLTLYINTNGATKDSTRGRPEIDRASLREMLLDSVPAETIRWGFHLKSVDENHRLIFEQGIETGFDLVVGSDGAWSKVRKVLTDQKPHHAGLEGFSWTIPEAKNTAPDCYELINRGSLFAFSDGKTIMCQQTGDGSLNLYTLIVQPEDWKETITYDIQNTEEVRAAALEEYKTWHPRLLDYLHHAQDPVARPICMLPVGWKWEHRAGVTLIGDAAHVMTPYAGEGVDLGLQDAFKLSQSIIKASRSSSLSAVDFHVQEYERDMFTRARRTAQCTLDMLNWMMFSDGTPRTTIEKIVLCLSSFSHGPCVSLLGVSGAWIGGVFLLRCI